MAESYWTESLRRTFLGPSGSAGRVVLSWILAGGICGGGLLIGAAALAGRGSPGLHLLLAPVLFLVGSAVGLVHGFVLALTGRRDPVTRGETACCALIAAGVAFPLLPLSWLVASSITVGTALQVETRLSWVIVSIGGACIGLLVCAWAAVEGWAMIASAYRRCPRRRWGVALAAATVPLTLVILVVVGLAPSGSRYLAWIGIAVGSVAIAVWLWAPAAFAVLRHVVRDAVVSGERRLTEMGTGLPFTAPDQSDR